MNEIAYTETRPGVMEPETKAQKPFDPFDQFVYAELKIMIIPVIIAIIGIVEAALR